VGGGSDEMVMGGGEMVLGGGNSVGGTHKIQTLFGTRGLVLAGRGVKHFSSIVNGNGNRVDKVKDLKIYPRSKSEADIIKELEKITNAKFPTILPSWLLYNGKSLELDGYNADLGIALEFSGPQHTKWIPSNEPYKTYLNRVMNDEAKKRICKENNVYLIVVDMNLPKIHWNKYLRSRLRDFNEEKYPLPDCDYINLQVADVYRDEHLEKELGLVSV
jgi:hypothetical protein